MATVRLFAVLREMVGAASVEVEGASVGEVVGSLNDRYGEAFAAVAARSSVVVDEERASLETPLEGDEEVALLPPVSGG